MKKYILTIALFIPLVIGCGNSTSNKENENSAVEVEGVELKKEVNTLDSIAAESEKVKKEIQESSEKVDEMLNEL